MTEPINMEITSSGSVRPRADTVLASELESCPDGVLVLRNGRASAMFNRRFTELWALPGDPALPRDTEAILSLILARVQDPDVVRAEVHRFRAEPEAVVRRDVRLNDGRVLHFHSGSLRAASGESVGRIWFFREVTAERRAASALEASVALLRATERIAHVGGWQWDAVRDELVWSDETCRIFGQDPAIQVRPMAACLAAVHPDDLSRVRTAIEECLQHKTPYDTELRVCRPDGQTRIVRLQAEVSTNAAGEVILVTGTSHDVTEQRMADAALANQQRLSKSLFESTPDGILVVGADRKIVLFNRRFLELWGIPSDVLQSRSDEGAVSFVLDHLSDPAGFVTRLQELYAHPQESADEELELRDGRVFWRHTAPLLLAGEDSPGRIFFFRDISERKLAEQRITHLAAHDALTGLANRRVFVEAVESAIHRARRGAKGFALIYIDLDHFKDINDTLGHPVGDKLLVQVAERLRSCARATDLVARFGGDEYAILQSDVTEPTDVARFAVRLQAVMRPPFLIDGSQIRSGATMGLSIHPPNGEGAEALLSQADLALYRAKGEERGSYRFYATSMQEEVRARMTLASELRDALECEQLYLVYQPQVEVATGRIVGLEALARWHHPTRGAVGPGEFIPVAEKTGLIPALGAWAMREACRQAKAWLDAGIAPPVVAVNVSALQFKTPGDLERMVARVLAEESLPPERLEIELTESALMDAWFKHSDVLVRLRDSGVRIAVDDFGTGFSSLEYLSRFHVDRIKIAQTFVIDLATRPGNAAIVKATLGLARELHLEVIAEGVETVEQLALLESWGCGEVQGYLFAKPLSVEAATALLREGVILPQGGVKASRE